MAYPRVLVISAAALNTMSATGVTMVNLFKGWPLDRIAQVSWDDSRPNPEICANYMRISHKDVPLVNMVKQLAHFSKFARSSATSIQPHGSVDVHSACKPARKTFLPGTAAAWADSIPTRLTKEFWQWIDDYKPEVIYSVLGSIRIMDIVLQVSNRLSIPIVPHFMDDWPSIVYRHKFTHIIPRFVLLSALKKILRKSISRMAISEAMAEEYKTRYGLQFETFMNCVEIVKEPKPLVRDRENTIIFGYVGGLHLNRWQSLLQVGDALLQIKNDGYDVELVVFAPSVDISRYGHLLGSNDAVRIGGSLSPDDMMTTLQQLDVLVHIESFEEQDRQYTRLSISTKIPQYMASGRPIIAYGPYEVASCRYVEEQACGLVVGCLDQASLVTSLRKLAESLELRQLLGQQGRKIALARHKGETERERFKEVLSRSITAVAA